MTNLILVDVAAEDTYAENFFFSSHELVLSLCPFHHCALIEANLVGF